MGRKPLTSFDTRARLGSSTAFLRTLRSSPAKSATRSTAAPRVDWVTRCCAVPHLGVPATLVAARSTGRRLSWRRASIGMTGGAIRRSPRSRRCTPGPGSRPIRWLLADIEPFEHPRQSERHAPGRVEVRDAYEQRAVEPHRTVGEARSQPHLGPTLVAYGRHEA